MCISLHLTLFFRFHVCNIVCFMSLHSCRTGYRPQLCHKACFRAVCTVAVIRTGTAMVPKVIAECCQFIGSGGNNIELYCSVATFVKHSLLFKMTFYILLCPFISLVFSLPFWGFCTGVFADKSLDSCELTGNSFHDFDLKLKLKPSSWTPPFYIWNAALSSRSFQRACCGDNSARCFRWLWEQRLQ